MFTVLRKRGRAWAGGGGGKALLDLDDVSYNCTRFTQDGKAFYRTGYFYLGYDGVSGYPDGYFSTSLRFPACPVPQGATITSATLKICAINSGSRNFTATVHGNDVDDAVAPDDGAEAIGLAKTALQSVGWNIAAYFSKGMEFERDVTGILQEIVLREGYEEGNAVQLILDTTNYTGSALSDTFYSHGGDDYRARLEIEWAGAASDGDAWVSPVMTSNSTSNPASDCVVSASSENSADYAAWKASDGIYGGDHSNHWNTAGPSDPSGVAWWKIHCGGKQVRLTEITLWHQSTSYGFAACDVYGSTDGENWTKLCTINPTQTVAAQVFNNLGITDYYTDYRFDCVTGQSPSYLIIEEIYLQGFEKAS